MSDLTRFADAVHAEIEERVLDSDQPVELAGDVAVAEVFVERLEELSFVVEPEFSPYCDTEGRNRCNFSGTSYFEEERRLVIFVGHFTRASGSVIPTVSDQDLSQLYGRAARFLSRALHGDYASFRGNAGAIDAARKVYARRAEVEQARVLILTDGRARSRDFEEIEIESIRVECDVVDLERLYRITQQETSRADIVIDFGELTGRPLPCLEMKPRAQDYDTYLTILSGDLIFALYEKYGQRLFEFNVRSYLQAKGKVNKGLRETLKHAPERFLAFNNGIVATADTIEAGLHHGELCITRMVGLQIVNGAQTTASIHRARKIDRLDLTKVAVATKVTRVEPEKLAAFVPLISRYANTQNSIQVADLSANSEFHIALERLSQTIWCPGEASRWFYERARGSYEVAMLACGSSDAARKKFKRDTPPNQRISKTDVARFWLSAAGRPYTVSMGAQKAFAVFMAELPDTFPQGWAPDADFFKKLIARAILYREMERTVRMLKLPAYRSNIVTYAVAYLLSAMEVEIKLDMIWERQQLSDALQTFLQTLAPAVDSAIRNTAGARNVTEWCKKPDCWEQVRPMLPSLPRTTPPEFIQSPSEEPEPSHVEVDTDDGEVVSSDIERCMELDAATWGKICHWGQLTQRLTRLERGVCRTLLDYADSGWKRQPSMKQARHGARAIELARQAEIID